MYININTQRERGERFRKWVPNILLVPYSSVLWLHFRSSFALSPTPTIREMKASKFTFPKHSSNSESLFLGCTVHFNPDLSNSVSVLQENACPKSSDQYYTPVLLNAHASRLC